MESYDQLRGYRFTATSDSPPCTISVTWVLLSSNHFAGSVNRVSVVSISGPNLTDSRVSRVVVSRIRDSLGH